MLYLCISRSASAFINEANANFLLNNSLGEPGSVNVLSPDHPTEGCRALPSHSSYEQKSIGKDSFPGRNMRLYCHRLLLFIE